MKILRDHCRLNSIKSFVHGFKFIFLEFAIEINTKLIVDSTGLMFMLDGSERKTIRFWTYFELFSCFVDSILFKKSTTAFNDKILKTLKCLCRNGD